VSRSRELSPAESFARSLDIVNAREAVLACLGAISEVAGMPPRWRHWQFVAGSTYDRFCKLSPAPHSARAIAIGTDDRGRSAHQYTPCHLWHCGDCCIQGKSRWGWLWRTLAL